MNGMDGMGWVKGTQPWAAAGGGLGGGLVRWCSRSGGKDASHSRSQSHQWPQGQQDHHHHHHSAQNIRFWATTASTRLQLLRYVLG